MKQGVPRCIKEHTPTKANDMDNLPKKEKTTLIISRDRLSELRDILPALLDQSADELRGTIDDAAVEMAQFAIDEWLFDETLWRETVDEEIKSHD